MSIETVRTYLQPFGKADSVLEFPSSSATVELAAQVLGVEGARIAKTLSFAYGEGCILLVTAGDARVNSGAFKREFGCKANMLSAEQVLQLTGNAVGGVCPFVQDRTHVLVVLDVSLKRFETVFPACGSSNSAIELTCAELMHISNADRWVDVCNGWNEDGK